MESLFTHTPFVPLLDASDLLVPPLVLLLPCPLKLFLVLPPLNFLVVDCCCPMAGRARTLFDGPGLGLRRPAEGLGTNCDGLAGNLGLSVSVDSPNTSASKFWLPLLTNFVAFSTAVFETIAVITMPRFARPIYIFCTYLVHYIIRKFWPLLLSQITSYIK